MIDESGDNGVAGRQPSFKCSQNAFLPLQGWNAATGLGPPDFSKLSALLSTLDTTSQSVALPTQSSATTQTGSALSGGTAVPPQQSRSATTTSSQSIAQSPGAKPNSASQTPNVFGTVAQVLKDPLG